MNFLHRASSIRTTSGPFRQFGLLGLVVALTVGWGSFDARHSVALAASVYYAAPNGSPSNDGSFTRPLDLVTALSAQGPVRPGDTVWLRGGEYRRQATLDGNGNPVIYYSNLTGTAAAPITVRQYPGERAILDGNLSPSVAVLVVEGSYATYWGFEITNNHPDRRALRAAGLDVYGHHNRFINLVIHDVGQGVGFWSTTTANDSELYGSVIYNVGWEGSDRGHGHSVYVQNVNGYKRIVDNIMFNGFSFGIHAYGESGRTDNIEVRGNIAFGHGSLSATGGVKANIYFNSDNPSQYPQIIRNFAYYPFGSGGRSVDIGLCNNGTIHGNYLAGSTPLQIYSCSSTLVAENTVVGPVAGSLKATYPNNFYSNTATGVVVNVVPNVHEPGRSNVVIYNWDRLPQVSVNLAGTGLIPGDQFEIRDVQNYLGAAVVTGTYQGAVSIPMTGLTIAPPVGNAPLLPPHTAPEFGAFVVRRLASGGGQLPTATFSASPVTISAGQSATLSWSASNATTVSINQGIGTVAASGSRVVSPSTTTSYTLTASNASGPTTVTATVTVSQPSSADGVIVPPATQIVDGSGAVWTIGAGQAILRNGVLAAGGYGTKLLWTGNTVYTQGLNGSWWKWTGSGWSNVGATQPGGSVAPPPPPPPPSGTSPDGTLVPPAGQIVDGSGAVWTLAANQSVLRNGAQAAGGSGIKLLWTGNTVYVLGSLNGSWWKWTGSGWSNVGTTQPGGAVAPPPPPPPPPSGTSTDGTLVPPAGQIVDGSGAVWTLAANQSVLRNGTQAAGGSGIKLLWTGNAIYALGSLNGSWWKWTGSGWSNVGTTQPGGAVAPPPPPPPPSGTSANGTIVPPAAQVVDSSGAVWTIGPSQAILRNGVQAGGGSGSKILWTSGSVYVLGGDGWTWWKWTGSWWTSVGGVQPS